MHPEIAEALSKLGSQVRDRAVREDAIIILAFAMEKSNISVTQFDYSNDLPPSLLDYQLPESEQREIVVSLLQLFESGLFRETGTFWAIGKALSKVIMAHLAPFLETYWRELNESLLHQTLASLNNGLFSDEDSAEEIAAILRQGNLYGCLNEILRQDFTPDSKIFTEAERALALIEDYGNSDGDAL